jgi:acyl-CoA synthetase (AMP-forming)/AMP-acid ligase II
VSSVLRRAATIAPASTAATLGSQSLTFGELYGVGAAVASVLGRRGLGRGARVAWWGPTSLDAALLFAGLARLGAVFVPVNARLAREERAAVLAKADPALVLQPDGQPLEAVVAEARALAASAPDPSPGITEDDPQVIFFTSGSTGAPKGVVLSQRANTIRSAAGNGVTRRGATVCMFPMFHMASWTLALGCWQLGEEIVFVEQPDAATLLGEVERRRARRLYAIPAVWARILAAGTRDFDLSSLTEADTGTSATPIELVAAIHDALPHTATRIFYGSTEAGPGAVLGADDVFRKPGSVGQPANLVELRLAGTGEVCVRSPFLMEGYFRDAEATSAALVDGWYHTGDLGALDDEGYLYIVGRARDIIRTGGETVAPVEVERVVAEHPAVAEVAVVGVPDVDWGEVVCAVVVLADGADGAPLDLAGLQSHCRAHLAGFKVPRRLEVVDALPRTAATGQVQRTLIVERLGLV